MVKLRLKRIGRKGKPFYRIVAMHSTLARGGPALDEVGSYDPIHARVEVDEEATIGWLKKGAQMSDTVHDLLKNQGVLAKFRGLEGSVRENALSRDKPKRKKKLIGAKADVSETDSAVDSAPGNESAELATAKEGEVLDSETEE